MDIQKHLYQGFLCDILLSPCVFTSGQNLKHCQLLNSHKMQSGSDKKMINDQFKSINDAEMLATTP